MGERPMGRFENRFVRAVAFSIVVSIAVVAVGVLQREPTGEDLLQGVISGLVLVFPSIFPRIGGPKWG
jgi:hypothetical protein